MFGEGSPHSPALLELAPFPASGLVEEWWVPEQLEPAASRARLEDALPLQKGRRAAEHP